MKNTYVLFISLFVTLFLCFGCINTSPGSSVSDSGVAKATVKVQTNSEGFTIEQENIIKKLEEDNKPGAHKYLYVISAMSGDVILFSTVDGKVTSSGKRLNPYEVAASDGEYVSNSLNGMLVSINGESHRTPEVLQDDGTYGHSIPYLYWWDTKGVSHIHYVSGGQIIHISDQPLAISKVIINLDTGLN